MSGRIALRKSMILRSLRGVAVPHVRVKSESTPAHQLATLEPSIARDAEALRSASNPFPAQSDRRCMAALKNQEENEDRIQLRMVTIFAAIDRARGGPILCDLIAG